GGGHLAVGAQLRQGDGTPGEVGSAGSSRAGALRRRASRTAPAPRRARTGTCGARRARAAGRGAREDPHPGAPGVAGCRAAGGGGRRGPAPTVARLPLVGERDAPPQSAPGLGPLLVRPLRADVPERGRLAHVQIAALGGVVPLNRASGARRGRRAVRAALSRGTVRATRCNPVIRPFYARLLAAGKAKKG